IASEHAQRIFERFTQADSTIQREYGGSGLGTTICKHLVELMGGEIGFDSAPGQGSLFWFTVRLSLQPPEAYEEGAGVSIRGSRIMVVSSRPWIQEWAIEAAREREIECVLVRSLDEMLVQAARPERTAPCAIVIDGEDDSFDWREARKTTVAAGGRVPFILFRADVLDADAFDAGYITVVRGKEPRLLSRAMRTVVAGVSAPAPTDLTAAAAPKQPGLRILVAEDNQISQQLITMMLQSGGHHVTAVSDGESALDQYEQVRFDLVILDMNMPGRNGLEVGKAIRVLEATGKTPRVPIIMLTASASSDLQEESEDAGIDLFLAKPVDPRALLTAVGQAYGRHSELAGAVPAPSLMPSANGGHVDRGLIEEMARFSEDPEFAQKLATQFSRDAQRLVDGMAAALVQKDYEQLRELAHALKGSSMMAGAIRLRDSAARAEKITDRNLGIAANDVIDELRGVLGATTDELLEMLAEEGNRSRPNT
ncbi:MAG TPA: response regulator, partial [Aggregatilineaceae bacterium]|nr:response regulator [Aggregatilineaceae bacterium]